MPSVIEARSLADVPDGGHLKTWKDEPQVT
jgi:hypothetical protein